MAKRFVGDPDAISKILTARIRSKLDAVSTVDKKMRAVMLRAGLLIEGHAKQLIRKKLNKDSDGHLINSIQTRFISKDTLLVGSFGLPYARIHEFGGVIIPKKARMLAIPIHPSMKGRRAKDVPGLFSGEGATSKILFQRRQDGTTIKAFVLKSRVVIPPRPYLAPSIGLAKSRIIDLMVEELGARLGSD